MATAQMKTSKTLLLIVLFLLFLTSVFPPPLYSQTAGGDLDNDGDIDFNDYYFLVESFAYAGCGNIADIDKNCLVDILDYNILVENFGYGATPTPSVQKESAMYRANPQHTGIYETKEVPSLNRIRWQLRPGNSGAASAPTVANGIVYFGSWDDYLYAVDAQTGLTRWTFHAQDFINYEPAVENDTVYFGDYAGYFYAVDINTQQEKWRFLTKSDKSGISFARNVKSPPTIASGKVYFSDSTGRLYALDTRTGQEIWEVEYPLIFRMTSPAIVDDIAYFGSEAGYLFAVDTNTGQVIWNFKTTYGGSIWASPAVIQGKVYFPSNDGFLYAVEAQTGRYLWAYKYKPQHIQMVFPQPVAVLNGKIYLSGTNDNIFEVLDAETGTLQGSFLTESWVESPPSIAENTMYFGTHDLEGNHNGYLYAVDTQTLQEKWKWRTQRLGINTSPVVSEGTVYFKDEDGYIYALE